MKYFRLTCLWAAALSALGLGVSALATFGSSAETRIGDSMIYPSFRFYRGGMYASVTEATIARIFSERLAGTKIARDLPERLAHHLYRLCIRHRMDPALILSVIRAESGFRLDAVSPAGAVGLMQLMPATARHLGASPVTTLALQDPFLNLELGIAYLRSLRERYPGMSAYYPLAAYNLGPHRLDTLRASPTFKPDKTLRYYEEIMRGIADWRRYGSQALNELSTIPAKPSALKTRPDAELKLELKRAARRLDPA